MKWFYYKFIYRRLMIFMHKRDWHKLERNPWLEPKRVHYWCHWCGLRFVREEGKKNESI